MIQPLTDEQTNHYPGTPQHQTLLQAIVSRYGHDPRILAVVFGSLTRGDWDEYSDLDLDVVITDDARIDVVSEVRQLCTSFTPFGERVAFIVPDGDDAADIVLESLMQLSIRYHPLADTSPNIVDGMKVLAGRLDHATIATAGMANQTRSEPTLEQLLDAYIRYAAAASVCLQRKQIWSTIEILHRMRGILMTLFVRTHGGQRTYKDFQPQADTEIQARIGVTLPRYNLDSLRISLAKLLEILEEELDYLGNGQVQLTSGHQIVLNRIRRTR